MGGSGQVSTSLPRENAITMVLHTRTGTGPVRLSSEGAAVSLIDLASGLPSARASDIAFGAVGDSLARL